MTTSRTIPNTHRDGATTLPVTGPSTAVTRKNRVVRSVGRLRIEEPPTRREAAAPGAFRRAEENCSPP